MSDDWWKDSNLGRACKDTIMGEICIGGWHVKAMRGDEAHRRFGDDSQLRKMYTGSPCGVIPCPAHQQQTARSRAKQQDGPRQPQQMAIAEGL